MRILYVEPFEGGSHATFTRVLTGAPWATWSKITLPARHWKWRMRGSAAYAALECADTLAAEHDAVFASSFVPLAELVGLAPALGAIPRVLYFHENQLAYPWREPPADRDLHYGFTQLVSALAASVCVFNSELNRRTFVQEGRALLRRMPDANPSAWIDAIEQRARVLPVPLELPDVPPTPREDSEPGAGPIILWNHRWEHDKGPEAFFGALRELDRRGVAFRVAVCGQRYERAPEIFEHARQWLGTVSGRIVHFGHCPARSEYLDLLGRAHLAVSTAQHEFFGLAMLEATHCGARPVVPDRLAYVELFPEQYRYDEGALADVLQAACRRFAAGDDPLWEDRRAITRPVLASAVLPRYRALLEELIRGRR